MQGREKATKIRQKVSNSYPQEEKVFVYSVQNNRLSGYLKKKIVESLEDIGNLKSRKKRQSNGK